MPELSNMGANSRTFISFMQAMDRLVAVLNPGIGPDSLPIRNDIERAHGLFQEAIVGSTLSLWCEGNHGADLGKIWQASLENRQEYNKVVRRFPVKSREKAHVDRSRRAGRHLLDKEEFERWLGKQTAVPKKSNNPTLLQCSIADVSKCEKWLSEKMAKSPDVKIGTKSKLKNEAKSKWPKLSDRGFDRAWKVAIKDTGA